MEGRDAAGGFSQKLLPTGVAVFERCSVSGTVSTPGEYAGGFIGSLGGGAVTNCTAFGDVTATASAGRYEQDAVGGFVGYVDGAADFYGCSAWGDVVARRASYGGGFVARTQAAATFNRCRAAGQVECGNYGGGFAGCYKSGAATNICCYALGDVRITGGCADGFVGQSYNGCFLTDCASYADVTNGYSYVGGFGGAISSYVIVTNCFAGGAVTNIRNRYVGGFAGSVSGTVTGSARNAGQSRWCVGERARERIACRLVGCRRDRTHGRFRGPRRIPGVRFRPAGVLQAPGRNEVGGETDRLSPAASG